MSDKQRGDGELDENLMIPQKNWGHKSSLKYGH